MTNACKGRLIANQFAAAPKRGVALNQNVWLLRASITLITLSARNLKSTARRGCAFRSHLGNHMRELSREYGDDQT